MTLINLTVLADALGTAAPIDAVLEAEATSARTAGAEARTPQKIVVPITAGAPSKPLNLEPTGIGWCWKLVLMVPATGFRVTRFVQVPASGTVTWEDLVDVNPLTLKVLPDAVPAWKAAMDDLLAARDAAVLAVTDAVTIQVEAQVTPKVTAAQAARTGAESARDSAVGAATVAEGHATAAGVSADAAATSATTAEDAAITATTAIPRIDNTAGRAIYTWDDTANREQLIYGDTGWRVLTSWNAAGEVTGQPLPAGVAPYDGVAGFIRIRREGYSVRYGLAGYKITANSPSFLLPSGFHGGAPKVAYLPSTSASSGMILRTVKIGAAQIYTSLSSGDTNADSAYASELEWSTNSPWPTTLPGTASGTIPHN